MVFVIHFFRERRKDANRIKLTGMNFVMYKPILIILAYTWMINVNHSVLAMSENDDGKEVPRTSDECQVTPVIHVLQYPGCVPKPIPSFACIGRCSSYLQVIYNFYKSNDNCSPFKCRLIQSMY